MLLPIYEADVLVMQTELEKKREMEQRQQIKFRQNQLSERVKYLSRIIDATPTGGYPHSHANVAANNSDFRHTG